MVSELDLSSDDEYRGAIVQYYLARVNVFAFVDILEDVKQECQKYGTLQRVVIPRVQVSALCILSCCGDLRTREQDGSPPDSVGRIFVEYNRPEEASSAALALAGKKFGEQTVRVRIGPISRYANRIRDNVYSFACVLNCPGGFLQRDAFR
jgi:hypothetical protein